MMNKIANFVMLAHICFVVNLLYLLHLCRASEAVGAVAVGFESGSSKPTATAATASAAAAY